MNHIHHASITLPDGIDMAALLGPADCNARQIEDRFGVKLLAKATTVTIEGDEQMAMSLLPLVADMADAVCAGQIVDQAFVDQHIGLLQEPGICGRELRDDVIAMRKGVAIRPKTAGQKRYIDAIRSNAVTFGIGPAGTGKTYLAMAAAVAALRSKAVSRIVLTRPVVEAGENLGFLPGTLEEKIDPYIRPLYDALIEMADPAKVRTLLERGVIELAPLAFMRGRTLNESFIILDEAQNTTPQQMKMFLTRLGRGSKMVITGDASQGDIAYASSGLHAVRGILAGIEGIAFVDLEGADVVRHSLVARIISAYDDSKKG